MAVDTLGYRLALLVTPADEQERAQVAELSKAARAAADEHMEIAFVDQGYTGLEAAQAAANEGMALCVVKLEEAKKGFVLLSRGWAECA